MNVAILTVFPKFFDGPLGEGMIRIARRDGKLTVHVIDLRDHTDDAHRTTDDTMYGGGAGMVMKADPIVRAWEAQPPEFRRRTLLTSARGRRFDEALAQELADADGFTIICGRYKGVDERVIQLTGAEEVSIGDYVLSGGEPAALVMIDAAVRHVPGVLGDYDSAVEDSYYEGLLGYPVYTKPEEYRGLSVPEVLLSGHHARIKAWRREEMLRATRARRPDLLAGKALSAEDRKVLARLQADEGRADSGSKDPGKGTTS
jgi:tRNA (guanine37-N1)-methyltransferase